MDLVILLGAGIFVYYVLTAITGWWDGYRRSHNLLLQGAAVVTVAVVIIGISQVAARTSVIDVAVRALIVLVLLAAAALAVVGRRRRTPPHAAPPTTAERSRPPPATRSRSRKWNSVYNSAGREVLVYAFGAFDNRSDECRKIKIGSTAQPEGVREAQVQEHQVTSGTETVRRLGHGPGGEHREKRMHARLHPWRYPASEWFEASPEVLAEVATLERLTDEGRRVTEAAKRRG